MRKHILALAFAVFTIGSFATQSLAACVAPTIGDDMVIRFPAAQGIWLGSASKMADSTTNTALTTGGILYYDTTANALKLCDGTEWITLGAGGSGGGSSAVGTAGEIQFSDGAGNLNASESLKFIAATGAQNVTLSLATTTRDLASLDLFGTRNSRINIGNVGDLSGQSVLNFYTKGANASDPADTSFWHFFARNNAWEAPETNHFGINYFNGAGFRPILKLIPDGRIGMGTEYPHTSAALEVNSTTTGFLPPRLTTSQRNGIASPASGLIIYNTTENALEIYNGTSWASAGSGSGGGSGAISLGTPITAIHNAQQNLTNTCDFAVQPTLTITKPALYYVHMFVGGYKYSGNIVSVMGRLVNSSNVSVFTGDAGTAAAVNHYVYIDKTGLVELQAGTYKVQVSATNGGSCATTTWNSLGQINVTAREVIGGGSGGSGADALADLTDVDVTGATSGQSLVFNGTTWAPASVASGTSEVVAVSVNRNNVNQTVTPSTWTPVDWTTKAFDTHNSFDLGTDRFQPPVAGYYAIYASVHCNGTGTSCQFTIFKNGTISVMTGYQNTANALPMVSGLVYMNGTTDYLTVNAFLAGSSSIYGEPRTTFFSAVLQGGSGSGGSGAETLADLTDVDLTGATSGQSLVFNGTTWAPANVSAAAGATIAFRGTFNLPTRATGQVDQANFTLDYNTGGAFNATTGIFTAPQNGVYAFTGFIHGIMPVGGQLYCAFKKNDVAQSYCARFSVADSTNPITSGSALMNLSAGDTVKFVSGLYLTSGTASNFFGDFSGVLLNSGSGGSGGGTASAAGNAGDVQFNDGSAGLAADTNFAWNNTTKRLSLGNGDSTSGLSVLGRTELREDTGGLGAVIYRSVANAGAPARLGLARSRGTAAAPEALQSGDALGSIDFQGYRGAGYTTYGGPSAAAIRAHADGTVTATSLPTALTFHTTALDATANTEKLRITQSGNVGIGITAPTTRLSVSQDASENVNGTGPALSYPVALMATTSATISRGLEIGAPTGGVTSPVYLKVKGTSSRFAIFNENDVEQFTITQTGNVGIGTSTPGQKLTVIGAINASSILVNGVPVASSTDTYWSPVGGGQIRYAGGSVLVGSGGAATSTANNAPTTHINPDGYIWLARNHASGNGMLFLQNLTAGNSNMISMMSGSTTVGTISTNGTGVSYNTTSDARLKENVTDSEQGLDTVMRIDVKDFNFISDAGKTRVQGFIAQQLYEVYPEAVTIGGATVEEPWSVDYGRLTPVVIKSIQQLKTENDALKARLEALEATVQSLQNKAD